MRGISLIATLLAGGLLGAAEPKPESLVNSLGMKLRWVEPGAFTQGAGDAPPRTKADWQTRDDDESPAHRVRLSRGFYLGQYEVTNAEFETIFPEHREFRGRHGCGKDDTHPVTMVTWDQARRFCERLSEREGKPYRLPTEAEWEYVCRAGGENAPADRSDFEHANLGLDRDGKTKIGVRTVGSYPAHPWGFFDLQGNAAEWCADWYGPYAAAEQTDPVGPAQGIARVVRGWSWLTPADQDARRFARAANRAGHLPDDANGYTGFRVVQSAAPTSAPSPAEEPALYQRDVRQTPAEKRAADPEPRFISYAEVKRNPTIPPETFGPIFSAHNHFSTVCVCPNGDVLAAWYTCVGEADRQLAQACSRLRAGADRWEPASLFFRVPDVNSHAPVLLTHGKRIYHFCTQSLHGWDQASDIVRHSDDNGVTWSAPQIMVARHDAQRLSQPCAAVVAADGTILLACDGDHHRDARLIVGSADGATWKVAGGDLRAAAGGKYVLHPALALRKDGSLLAFLRGQDPMPIFATGDRGETWSAVASPFGGIHVGQKAAALRLTSGAIVLFTHDMRKQFGGGSYLALSDDDGLTWPHARKVPGVSGYLSLAQGPDELIYLVGSRLNFAACNEAWLRAGEPLPTP